MANKVNRCRTNHSAFYHAFLPGSASAKCHCDIHFAFCKETIKID